jgi:hypothetical protein
VKRAGKTLWLRFRCVSVTHCGAQTKFNNHAQKMGCDVWAAWVVTNVFREFFFATVLCRKARVNRYSWRKSSPVRTLSYFCELRGWTQVGV